MLIREDDHGLFVIADGSIYRPVPTVTNNGRTTDRGPWPIAGVLCYVPGVSNHQVGTKVPGRHLRNCSYASVGGELWVSHGAGTRFNRETGQSERADSNACFLNERPWHPLQPHK
jgi:hypothetical protein